MRKDKGSQREYDKTYRKSWRQRHPDRARAYRIKERFGLSVGDLNSIITEQGHKCPICQVPIEYGTRSVHIDHDHASGKVRGVLCELCNRMLGMARDNPTVLRMGASYLERFGGMNV